MKNLDFYYDNSEHFKTHQTNGIIKFIDKIDYFPVSRALDHSMSFSLDEYVSQKLPISYLNSVMANRGTAEIHGIYPANISYLAKNNDFKDIKVIDFKYLPNNKDFNYIRPQFFTARRSADGAPIFIATTTPGKDYIYHYASLMRHMLSTITNNYDKLLTLHRYPFIEETICQWTGLDNNFIKQDDYVVIGYVNEIRKNIFNAVNQSKIIGSYDNEYYTSYRYQLKNKKIVNFLGVKYSFWGCISSKIASTLCSLNVKEIIYAGKLGAFTSPDDLYTKIFSPCRYLIMNYNKVIECIEGVKNNFANKYCEYNTGMHVSVPTVLEEDLIQGVEARMWKANSIDNEISQIALAIQNYNIKNNKNVSFSPIHFATDFIRSYNDHRSNIKYGLHNNRDFELLEKKQKILKIISLKLLEYLEN